MRARKMKRMDRRPKYWRCSFCRQENVVAEQRSVYNTGTSNVAWLELGDGDAVARERARRTAREKETRGRSLNARRRL